MKIVSNKMIVLRWAIKKKTYLCAENPQNKQDEKFLASTGA